MCARTGGSNPPSTLPLPLPPPSRAPAVCTALQAICRVVTPELISVFQPQVVALLRHDRDLVKKKALLAMQRFLQVDPTVAPEVERHLIDKIGYKVRGRARGRVRWLRG